MREDDVVTVEKAKLTGNDRIVLKYLRAMKRVKTFIDEQDATIDKLINAYEEGNISKSYTNAIVRELKKTDDPMEAYYIITGIIPDKLLEERRDAVIKHEGKKQVILSEYIIPGENHGN